MSEAGPSKCAVLVGDAGGGRTHAEAALAQRYRLRLVLELRHEDRVAVVPASTMAETPAELSQAAAALLAITMPRLLERLVAGPAREDDEP